MSTYTDASLIMYPSGYKEDKIYSLKPTDGSGDLTFTRASTATRVNAEGLVEQVPYNLIEQSNSFNTGWSTTSGTSVTSGQSGYDGTNDAWLLTDSGNSSAYALYRGYSNTGIQSASIYAKQGSTSQLEFDFLGGSGGYLRVNLSDGSLHSTFNTISWNTENVGNGWWRVSFSTNHTSAPVLFRIGCNGAGSIYIQDAQVNIGATAKPYFPTTDRLNVPRIDYTGGGCGSLLLEKQSTNLVTYSEQFDNAAWTKGSSNSVTANAIISPDGTQNADFLFSTVSNSSAKYAYQVTASTANPTATIYAKAGAVTEMLFYCANGDGIYFNLTNGAFVAYYGSGSSTITSYSSVAVGNGWYRYSLTFNISVTSIEVYMSVSANISPYIANGDGLYIWGAQLEASSYPTSYIPCPSSSSVTRLADAIPTKDITSFSIGNSYTILIDAKLNALENNKVFFAGKTSANTDSFTLRNFNGLLRLYNNIDSAYPVGAISSSTNKWVLRIEGTSYKIFAYGSALAGTFTTARNLGKFNFDGSLTELKMQNLTIFPSAISDADCISLTL